MSDINEIFKDEGDFRRRFPRRDFSRKVGVLFGGRFFSCESSELGEGGLAISSDYIFDVGRQMVVSFQIPSGDFVSLRATVKSTAKHNGQVVHGLAFVEVPFQNRRQIRSYVSERTHSHIN